MHKKQEDLRPGATLVQATSLKTAHTRSRCRKAHASLETAASHLGEGGSCPGRLHCDETINRSPSFRCEPRDPRRASSRPTRWRPG